MRGINKALVLVFISAVGMANLNAAIKVACIGNSITAGEYPGLLQGLLGPGYQVENDGVGGKTLLRKGDGPYWTQGRFPQVFAFQPNIVTVKLGTNDSKPWNWTYKSEFAADLNSMVDTLQTLASKPIIYLVLPVPAFPGACCGIDGQVIENEVIPLIKQVAAQRHLQIIDCHTPLLPFPQYFPDGVHPNTTGADSIAHVFYRALLAPPFNFDSPDTVTITANIGDTNPKAAVAVKAIDTFRVPVLTASADSGWCTASVSGSGPGQVIQVAANITGRISGIYYARLSVSGAGYTVPRTMVVKLRINGMPVASRVVISPAADTIHAGASAAMKAVMRDQFSDSVSGAAVTWSVSGGGTIDNTGLFRSAGDTGTFKVRATYTGNSSLFTEAVLRVLPFAITSWPGGTITAQYSDNPATEGIANVIDGSSSTKFLTFHAACWIQFCTIQSYVINKYSITSGNDAPERDPRGWTLQGSRDGTTWTTLDTRAGETFASRYQTNEYSFNNITAYSCYRLTMTNTSGTVLQLADWELRGPFPAVAAADGPVRSNCLIQMSVTSGNANSGFHIKYLVPPSMAGAKAFIQVYDMRGRLLWSREQTAVSKGNNICWPGVNAAGSPVTGGGYAVQVKLAGRALRQKITVAR